MILVTTNNDKWSTAHGSVAIFVLHRSKPDGSSFKRKRRLPLMWVGMYVFAAKQASNRIGAVERQPLLGDTINIVRIAPAK